MLYFNIREASNSENVIRKTVENSCSILILLLERFSELGSTQSQSNLFLLSMLSSLNIILVLATGHFVEITTPFSDLVLPDAS